MSPDALAYAFREDGDDDDAYARITFAELDARARAIAKVLGDQNAKGERAVLLYAPGLEYIAGFFGCLYAGAIAVPAYPPEPARIQRTLPRLQAIFADAGARFVLTTTPIKELAGALFSIAADLGEKTWIATDTIETSGSLVDPSDIAFLQYTSGSTGSPRGVVLAHRHLIANALMIREAMALDRPNRVMVSWLPPYHDMGLIGGILAPMFGGFPAILMSPGAFLQKPIRWLRAIDKFAGTVAGAPNFGFDLCVRKVRVEDRATLDLSSLDVMFCGAEPIRVPTVERFLAEFASTGLRRSAFYPCYGLAEGTLIVSGGTVGEPPKVVHVSSAALADHRVVAVPEATTESIALVGCGRALRGEKVLVVDPETMDSLPEGYVGEIWISAPSVAAGYWGRPSETEQTFEAVPSANDDRNYLRSGDLGFLRDGELFVTGRLKDVIIIRGKNRYPHDIEETLQRSSDAMRPGCGVAFTVTVNGEEQLVVVQELDRRHRPDRRSPMRQSDRPDRRADPEGAAFAAPAAERSLARVESPAFDPATICASARAAIAIEHALSTHAVVLIKPGSLPKTSSGKVQRRATKEAFLNGSLDVIHADSLEVQTSSVPSLGPTGRTVHAILSAESKERRSLLFDRIQRMVVRTLRMRDGDCDPTTPLTQLGLDSLMGTQLVAQILASFHVEIPMRSLFEGLTLESLAAQVDRAIRSPAIVGAPIVPVARTGQMPLSFAQERIWFLQTLHPASTVFNLVVAFQVVGDLELSALETAVAGLVARHESLRTEIYVHETVAAQRVLEDVVLPITVVDASGVAASHHEQWVKRHTEIETKTPFDLAKAPLMRVRVIRFDDRAAALLLTAHHVIADGWSASVVVRELAALYDLALTGQGEKPLPLLVQPVDYAAWQRSRAAGEQLEYWKTALAGLVPALDLPTDRARPALQSFTEGTQSLRLSASLTRRLRDFSRNEGITLFTTLLSAFSILLHKYSGLARDIPIGVPVANRLREETWGMVGCLVNTLVVRAEIEPSARFLDSTARLRDRLLSAYANQEVPFEKMVEIVNPPRDLSRSPLVQVTFNLLDSQTTDLHSRALSFHQIGLEPGGAEVDLAVVAQDRDDRLAFSFRYDAALFEARTVEQMGDHLRVVLEAVTSRPDIPVADISLLVDEEWAEAPSALMGILSDDRAPAGADIVSLFAEQVRASPEAIALRVRDTDVTYRELDVRSSRLAMRLHELGAGLESQVGVHIDKSIDMVVALLGIAKTGAAWVPLDPAYPAERIRYFQEDSQLDLICVAGTVPPESRAHLVDVRTETADERPLPKRHPLGLAYAIYTSGSTGRPKAVGVTHGSLANLLFSMKSTLGSRRSDTWLSVTSLSFDIAALEIFLPLISGGRLVLAERADVVDGAKLVGLIERNGVNYVQATPGTWELLDEGGFRRDDCTALCGGEAMSRRLAGRLKKRAARVFNVYGPTETTIWSSAHLVSSKDIFLGRPLLETFFYVLDDGGRRVPERVPGELFIGGRGVARGYLGRADLTAERFVPDPFTTAAGERMYATGDLVRFRSGLLEFLGRIDQQVKIRGHRIELGEVESVLQSHAGIQGAVAIARASEDGSKEIVAYVIGEGLSPAVLREHMKTSVPDYMVPSAYVVMQEFPRTPNGKLDRQKLPVPDARSRQASARASVPARNTVERVLVRLWSDMLGVPNVGIHDDFFALGGHSLLATRVLARFGDLLDLDVPIATIFVSPTIASLSAAVHELPAELGVADRAEIAWQLLTISEDEAERLISQP